MEKFIICPIRAELQNVFAQATLRSSRAMNEEMIAVIRGADDLDDRHREVLDATALRRTAKEALLKHIGEHGC